MAGRPCPSRGGGMIRVPRIIMHILGGIEKFPPAPVAPVAPASTVNAKCPICGHQWIVAYLPMYLEAAARLMKAAACPKCGDDKPVIA